MSRGFAQAASGGLPGLIGASVLVSAYIHGELFFEGMSKTPVIGPLFLLNAIGGLAIGLTVLFWRHWLPFLAALGFGVLTLAGFWLSVTVGLSGLQESAAGVAQIAAEVAEIVTIVGCVVLFVKARGRTRPADLGAQRSTRRASA